MSDEKPTTGHMDEAIKALYGMTKDEFITSYMARSRMPDAYRTPDGFRFLDADVWHVFTVRFCDCGWEGCQGWQMVKSREAVTTPPTGAKVEVLGRELFDGMPKEWVDAALAGPWGRYSIDVHTPPKKGRGRP